jgi:hypothetical protein
MRGYCVLERTAKSGTFPGETAIERKIAAKDEQIDALVYELYGLTEEKIRISVGGEK